MSNYIMMCCSSLHIWYIYIVPVIITVMFTVICCSYSYLPFWGALPSLYLSSGANVHGRSWGMSVCVCVYVCVCMCICVCVCVCVCVCPSVRECVGMRMVHELHVTCYKHSYVWWTTVNMERFAGLHFCIFHSFQEYRNFFHEYKCLS